MTHEYSWDSDNPLSSGKAGLGYLHIQNALKMVYERMAVDHNMDNVLLPTVEQDGTHKKVTLKDIGSDAESILEGGRLYCRTEGDYIELFYIDNNGHITQITREGNIINLGTLPSYAKYIKTEDQSFTELAKVTFPDVVMSDGISVSSEGDVTVDTTGFFMVHISIERTEESTSEVGRYYLYRYSSGSEILLKEIPIRTSHNFMFPVWFNANDAVYLMTDDGTTLENSFIEIIGL